MIELSHRSAEGLYRDPLGGNKANTQARVLDTDWCPWSCCDTKKRMLVGPAGQALGRVNEQSWHYADDTP